MDAPCILPLTDTKDLAVLTFTHVRASPTGPGANPSIWAIPSIPQPMTCTTSRLLLPTWLLWPATGTGARADWPLMWCVRAAGFLLKLGEGSGRVGLVG